MMTPVVSHASGCDQRSLYETHRNENVISERGAEAPTLLDTIEPTVSSGSRPSTVGAISRSSQPALMKLIWLSEDEWLVRIDALVIEWRFSHGFDVFPEFAGPFEEHLNIQRDCALRYWRKQWLVAPEGNKSTGKTGF